MSEFYSKLFHKVVASLPNDHQDNYSFERFGKPAKPASLAGKVYDTKFVTRRFINRSNQLALFSRAKEFAEDPLFKKFEGLYGMLADQASKDLLVDLVAFRMLGHKKVKLPLNNPDYWRELEKCGALKEEKGDVPRVIYNIPTSIYHLGPLGYDIKIRFLKLGILIDFVIEQYKYSSKDKTICVEPGDVVIDGGGFWGDTALYFASKAGSKGKVFTFEFIPGNLNVLKENLSYNPALEASIQIVPHPLWENEKDFYYIDRGPSSRVFTEDQGNGAQQVRSKSIDMLVAEQKLDKVDFIKMDIEGAEPYALKGAEATIRKFRPKLAISIYHSVSDMVSIPEYIHSLGLGYKLYLGHYTIYEEETLIFATTE